MAILHTAVVPQVSSFAIVTSVHTYASSSRLAISRACLTSWITEVIEAHSVSFRSFESTSASSRMLYYNDILLLISFLTASVES